MSEIIYIMIIAELLFVSGFCGYMIYRLKQRLTRLAKRLNPSASDANTETQVDLNVISYFISQLKRTRSLSETELGAELELNPLVTSVRCAYLNAERRALKQPENGKAYWLILKEEINKLIGMLSTEAKRTGVENTELREKLKLLKDRLEKIGDKEWLGKNAKATSGIPKNKSGYMLKFSRGVDATYQSASRATDGGNALSEKLEQQKLHTKNLTSLIKEEKTKSNLEVRIAEYERMLYKMEHESGALQKELNNAKTRLAYVDQAINSSNPDDKQSQTLLSVIRASSEETEKHDNTFDDLIADTQNIGNQSRKNIDGLQKTIFDQRKSILSMESTIAALEAELTGDSAADNHKRTELEKLKRALMESEGCIQILENEVETLYSDLLKLQQQREELQEHYKNKSDEEILASALEQQEETQLESAPEESTDDNQNSNFLTKFMTNAIESGSMEDLATVLQHSISEFGFESLIRLTVKGSNVDIAAMGKLSKEDKQLLERIEFAPGEEVQANTRHITIHFRNVRAILKQQGDNQSISDLQQQFLHAIFGFSSSLASKVAAQKNMTKRLDNYEYFNEMLQTISANLEAQNRYQRDETQSIIQSIVDQSHMLAGEKATPGQQTVLKAMEDEANQRTQLLEANRTIVRKQFTKIMEKLKSVKS